jgi:AcrR family transcriptional regulator
VIGEQRRAQILAAARRRLLDEDSVEAITMRRLGALVGIRGPSLYKHLSSRDQIHTALAIEALTDLADILEPVPRTFTGRSPGSRPPGGGCSNGCARSAPSLAQPLS